MTKRETMLRRLSAAQFTQWELHLYLDTHPSDLQALALFRKCDARYRALRSEYEAQFGALTALSTRPVRSGSKTRGRGIQRSVAADVCI